MAEHISNMSVTTASKVHNQHITGQLTDRLSNCLDPWSLDPRITYNLLSLKLLASKDTTMPFEDHRLLPKTTGRKDRVCQVSVTSSLLTHPQVASLSTVHPGRPTLPLLLSQSAMMATTAVTNGIRRLFFRRYHRTKLLLLLS